MADHAPRSFLQRLVASQVGGIPLIRPRPRGRFEMVDSANENLSTVTMYQNPTVRQRVENRPVVEATLQTSLPAPSPVLSVVRSPAEATLVAPPSTSKRSADLVAADHDRNVVASPHDAPQPAVTMSELKTIEQYLPEQITEPAPASEPAAIMTEPKLVEQLQPERIAEPAPAAEPAAIKTEPEHVGQFAPEPTAVPSPPAGPVPGVMLQSVARLAESRSQAHDQPSAAREVVREVAQPTTVHVSIGRVEIKAVPLSPNGRTATRKGPPVQSLDDYLDARREG